MTVAMARLSREVALRVIEDAASGTESRNTRLRREIAAEVEADEQERRAMLPEERERMERLAAAFGAESPADDQERRTRAAEWRFREVSFACAACGHEFETGEVIHRKRRWDTGPWGMTWALWSYCEGCVSKWHPSWLETRCEPMPCPGGCGALISWWNRWNRRNVAACSRRCADLVRLERKRVHHDDRTCEQCGESFTPTRADARYCKSACRQSAYRHRKAAA